MTDRRTNESWETNQRQCARALISADAQAFTSADARAFMLSQPSASRVAELLALEIPPPRERESAQAPTRGRENTPSWRSPVSLASAMIFAILLALGLHSASRSGSLAALAVVSPERFEARSEESAMRKNPKSFAVAAAAALSVSFTAAAQDAVQWRVEDGGNGHWYRVLGEAHNWPSARARCQEIGGYLATLASTEEWTWVVTATAVKYGYVGGYQDVTGTDYSEPYGGWRWVTGEPFTFNGMTMLSFDDCPGAAPPSCACGFGAQDVLFAMGCCGHMMNDSQDGTLGDCNQTGEVPYPPVDSIIEWSADCNSDGIVDFGQILAGELDDANGNNIPDCCEAGIACNCSADVTGNGNVDAADLAAVLSAWGGAPSGKENADINGDGSIDAADLAGVLSAWGPCP